MVTIIPRRLRVPVALGLGVLGILVLFSSYSRWSSGPFYGWSFNGIRALGGAVVLWVAFHVYRHQHD